MKKKSIVLVSLVLLIGIGMLIVPDDRRTPHIRIEKDGPVLTVDTENEEIVLKPWLEEENEIYYFFLPSFVKTEQIVTGMWDRPLLNWEPGELYEIEGYTISLMKSSVISSMFINTASGSMDAIHADKEYEEPGRILVMTAGGIVDYEGELEKIGGRGNSSWEYEKKPYSIKLTESKELCGLEKGGKWNLLPIWRESNKMNTKVLFDIAAVAGLKYTPECTWVDLYLNQEYVGIYLLSETVSVSGGRVEIADLEEENELLNPNLEDAEQFAESDAKGYELANIPQDISGGYLIEKDLEEYYAGENVGFVTEAEIPFSIAAPQHASREQVSYIQDYVQKIEDLLNEGSDEIVNWLDIRSFAAKYLVDEISLNFDANITSMYFYKDRENPLLYAGPVWDYDGALGECNAGYAEGWCVDYQNSILHKGNEFDWYTKLYEYDVFQMSVKEQYQILLPYLKEMLDHSIDLYAHSITDSVAMDGVRWRFEGAEREGNYQSFANNVRYLKYFLSARLEWMNDRMQAQNYRFHWSGTKEDHEVIFLKEGQITETMQIKDGNTLEQLPALEEEIYYGWYFEHNGEKYRDKLPILEDTRLYARKKEQ